MQWSRRCSTSKTPRMAERVASWCCCRRQMSKTFICIIIIMIIILVVNGVGLLEVEGALRIAVVAKNWNARRRPKMMNMEWGDIRLMDIPPKRFSNESLINTNIHTNDWRFPPLPSNDAGEVVVLVSATNAPLATSTMEAPSFQGEGRERCQRWRC